MRIFHFCADLEAQTEKGTKPIKRTMFDWFYASDISEANSIAKSVIEMLAIDEVSEMTPHRIKSLNVKAIHWLEEAGPHLH